jgi:hypothetical protein
MKRYGQMDVQKFGMKLGASLWVHFSASKSYVELKKFGSQTSWFDMESVGQDF